MSDFADTIHAVAIAIQARVPVYLEGPVGDGKTSIIEGLFQQLCDDHQTSIVALHEPPEYGGYPVPRTATEAEPEGVALLPVRWVARLAKVPEDKLAGLFLDELPNGAPATRSAAMRGILNGVWGEQRVPALTTVAAGNPVEISESGYELSAPLSNRFCHIEWDMPIGYWVEAMLADFPRVEVPRLPKDWRAKHVAYAKTVIAAFARARAGALKNMPKEAAMRAKPFPSLRSVTFARDLLAASRSLGYDLESNVTLMLVAGCIGPGTTHELLTFAKELDLPDPEKILEEPEQLVLPKRGDRAYAILTGVVAAVIANNSLARWNKAWAVLARAVELGAPDVAAAAARVLARARPEKRPLPPGIGPFIPLLRAAGLTK